MFYDVQNHYLLPLSSIFIKKLSFIENVYTELKRKGPKLEPRRTPDAKVKKPDCR